MKNRTVLRIMFIASLFLSLHCSHKQQTEQTKTMTLTEQISRFAPTLIKGDIHTLKSSDQQAVMKLIEASRFLDAIYLQQKWHGNPELLTKLQKDTSGEGAARLHYFMINMGPWSNLDDNQPFLDGIPTKLQGANYYPEDMKKEEFNRWLPTLSASDQKKAVGFFSTIRRDANGKLMIVPYSLEYKRYLESAAQLLREAARLTTNASLKKFLRLRADAFFSDDYYASDVAWMELESPIEITYGPYEVYMDELFNYKAAFESFVSIRNEEETRKLEKFASHLQEVENNLPIENRYKNPRLGAMAPIRVVDEIWTGGEPRSGVQTAAFNLPNDERVVREKGSKRVMLKNVQEAKFGKVLLPIADQVLAKEERGYVSFKPFFTHILAHELMHGLGPHSIIVDGKQSTVRQAMKDLGSAFEEAKADISGLWMLQFLIDKGVLPKEMEKQMYATFLASIFRSVRFGLNEAHGKGVALIFNYISEKGGFVYDDEKGVFSVDFSKIAGGVRELTGEIMTIQAQGSYEEAAKMLKKYSVIHQPMEKAIAGLKSVPVDIEPVFEIPQ